MVRPCSHRFPVLRPAVVFLSGDMFQERSGDDVKDVATPDPLGILHLYQPAKVW